MAANAQIDLEQFLGKDEMKGLAKQAWLNILHARLGTEADADRILTNDAYAIVGKLVEEKHHIELESWWRRSTTLTSSEFSRKRWAS